MLTVSYTTAGLEGSFGISLSQVGWVTTITLLGSVIGGVVFGWIGVRLDR